MIKTLLLDTFLLMGIIWMLISIVYFCIRLDRLLSSMEKPVVETMEETAEVVLSEEETSSPSVHSDYNSFEDYRNRFLHTSRFPRKMYVVKQKCTTANIVIYSDISFFYYQKFFC